MIAFLQGDILSINLINHSLILNVNGVGYELICSQNSLDKMVVGDSFNFHVYTHVKEDALQLYGFYSFLEKQTFLSLLRVNGVGPKMALGILSASPVERLTDMINSGDVKGLVQLPKIGKKTAEQIILSLKGKLNLLNGGIDKKPSKARDEIVSALVNLGFKLSEVETVVDQLDDNCGLQDGIREGLAVLSAQV